MPEQPKVFFIRVVGGRVVDVCHEFPDAQRFVVIDEDEADCMLDSDDGGSFSAGIYDVGVTAPHFDQEQAMEASVGTMSNGSVERAPGRSPRGS